MKQKIKNINLDKVFYIMLGLFCVLLFITTKYSLRLGNYVIIPLGIYKAYSNRKYEKTGFEYFIFAFIFAIGISSIGAFDFRGVRDGFLDTLTMFCVFLSISQFQIKEKLLKCLCFAGLVGYGYKVIISYLERLGYIKGLYWGSRISGGEEVWRYAPVITFGVIIALCVLIFRKNTIKINIALVAFFFITLEVLIKTQNRGNWVALIVCFVLMMMLKLEKKAIYPILILFLLMFGISKKYAGNVYVNRLNTIIKNGDVGRVEVWKASVQIFEKNYINGVGYSYKNFINAETPEKYIYLPKYGIGHSHNSSLYILATMGIIGILSYLSLILKMLWFTFENRKLDYGISFFMILSIQIFSLFETPVKYLDLTGIQLVSLGILYNLKNKS
ncbi:MAG: O-antigen ligase family protein [Fusobacteriaceae bacterium]